MKKIITLFLGLALALGAGAKTVSFTINADKAVGGTHNNQSGNPSTTDWFTHWVSPADENGITFKLDKTSTDPSGKTKKDSPLRLIPNNVPGVGLLAWDYDIVYQMTLGAGSDEYYVYGYTYKATPTLSGIYFNGEVLPVGGATFEASGLSSSAPFVLTFITNLGANAATGAPRVDITDFVITLKSRTSENLTSFSFEEKELPTQWTVANAAVAFNNDHATRGSNSMMLTIAAGQKAEATVDFAQFTPTAAQALTFDIYSVKATNTPIKVEFPGSSLAANGTLNLKGWQHYRRAYTADFAGASAANLTQMRLTIDNSASAEPLKIYLDNIDLLGKVGTVPTNTNSDATYNAMPIMAPDVEQIQTLGSMLLRLYSFENESELTEPTADELAGLEKIKKGATFALDVAPSDADLQTARDFVTNLNVTYHADGTLKCKAIESDAANFTAANASKIINYLSWLAASDTESDAKLTADLLAAMMDQNVMYRYPRMRSNTYAPIRLIPRVLIACARKCADPELAQRTIEAARWVAESGWAFAPQQFVATNFSSDILYLFPGFWVGTAANDTYTPEAVRLLKGVSNLLGKIVTPNDGGYDMIKPDGCGYHHGYHYNNYMYAFNTWISTAAQLQGTPFRISEQAYSDMKRALLATYIMSNRSDTGQNLYANSLSGRHPFSGGQINQVKPAAFEKFIQVSADLNGGTPDPELAAAYNHFMLSDKYDVAEQDYSGFYQFNYSPIGVYRSQDWVVTMRCPTERAIGAEIYSASNRFGRYQSSGSMEVVYNGAGANSGHPATASGYDWRIVPGATTVHHSKWSDLTPKGNTSQRFDQFSGGNNYAGALSMGQCGIFSCDYNQTDNYYNTQCFTPTGLRFRKSVLAIDGKLVCIGSAIYAPQATDDITASNLFQEVGDGLGAIQIGAQSMSAGDADQSIDCSNTDAWVLSPCGTGYYIPAGNAATLRVKYGTQQGPNENGSDMANPATATAARAYLDHGKAPSNKGYIYVAMPGATADDMEALAASFGSEFELLSTSGLVHGFYHKPSNTTALSYFKKSSANPQGIIQAVGSGMLIMYQPQNDGTVKMSVCVPDLNPINEGTYVEQWGTQPTQTSITLQGEWTVEPTPAVRAQVGKSRSEPTTNIELTMAQGEPQSFTLTPTETTLISSEMTPAAPQATYDLQGRRVSSVSTPGIYIINGTKRLVK